MSKVNRPELPPGDFHSPPSSITREEALAYAWENHPWVHYADALEAENEQLRKALVGIPLEKIRAMIPEICPRCAKIETHPLHEIDGKLRHAYMGDLLAECSASRLHTVLAIIESLEETP